MKILSWDENINGIRATVVFDPQSDWDWSKVGLDPVEVVHYIHRWYYLNTGKEFPLQEPLEAEYRRREFQRLFKGEGQCLS